MKRSLLEIVQVILSDMNGDAVDSISDTIESEQVAVVVRESYFEILSNRNWPHMERLTSLSASTDFTKPTHMKITDNVKTMTFINYNKIKASETRNNFEKLEYLQPEEFLAITNDYNNDKDNIRVITDYTGINFQVLTDRAPKYYTSFDDTYIVCDSYDSDTENTLQESKVQAKAVFMPTWEHVDEHVPNLPESAFMLLIEEAKSTAFLVVLQEANQKAEQKAVRQNKWISQNSRRVSKHNPFSADYGRRPARLVSHRHIPKGGDQNQ